MEANEPLEDRWPADSLNRHMATRSLFEENLSEAKTFRTPMGTEPRAQDPGVTMAKAALASLVTCTLPLGDLLRLKPGVWDSMAQQLQKPTLPKAQAQNTTQA